MTATVTDHRFPPFETTPEERQGPAMARPRPRTLAHGLTDEQVEFFWTQGYISLPGVFSASEMKDISDAADELYHSPHADPKNMRYDFASNVLWKIDPFFDLNLTMRKCVFDRRILDPLASIYGGREARLFKDKLIYKPPHSHGNGLHQDYNWWQGYPTSLLSVSVSIDPGTEDNGCTVVYPRDTRLGFIGQKGSFQNDAAIQADPSCTPDKAVKNIAQPGDVLIFHCHTPHEAGPNKTDGFRRQMFLSYNDSADGEFYFSHGEHYREYFMAARKHLTDMFFL